MNPAKFLPTIIMIVDFLATIPYAIQGNWRQAIYWLGCAIVTFAVTWL